MKPKNEKTNNNSLNPSVGATKKKIGNFIKTKNTYNTNGILNSVENNNGFIQQKNVSKNLNSNGADVDTNNNNNGSNNNTTKKLSAGFVNKNKNKDSTIFEDNSLIIPKSMTDLHKIGNKHITYILSLYTN